MTSAIVFLTKLPLLLIPENTYCRARTSEIKMAVRYAGMQVGISSYTAVYAPIRKDSGITLPYFFKR